MAGGYSNLDIVSDFGIRISDFNVAITVLMSHFIVHLDATQKPYRSACIDDTGGVYHTGFESANSPLFERPEKL